jgi:tripartite-type tricarboxylate transporter receptor subunit TctC
MKRLLRRVWFSLLIVASPVAISPAFAETPWPQKPVRIVVPVSGGGSADILCRLVAERLAKLWNQPVNVDNQPGANGELGGEILARAPADGYSLLCSPPEPLTINQYLGKALAYDPDSFAPITVLASIPDVIAVRRDLPVNSVQELIAYAKSNPGKVSYASQGNGSPSHLAVQMFALMAGIDLLHVPSRTEVQALAGVAASRADIYIGNIATALRFGKAKDVRFLGLTARHRSSIAPAVPDAAEIGLPKLIAGVWFALAAPPGTPDAIVQKINADTVALLQRPDLRAKFEAQGAEPVGQGTAATAAFFKDEEARWSAVIKSANITLD